MIPAVTIRRTSSHVAWLRDVLCQEPYAPALDELTQHLPPETPCYLMGGCLRDAMLSRLASRTIPVHDLDVVGDFGEELDHIAASLPGRLTRTPLGGYRWFPSFGSTYVDIWSIGTSYVITQFGLPSTIEGVMLGAPFNLERICFEFRVGQLLDGGCIEGIHTRTIRFDPICSYMLPIQAARAMSLRRKTGFRVDQTIHRLLRESQWESHRDDITAFFAANAYAPEDIDCIFSLLENAMQEVQP